MEDLGDIIQEFLVESHENLDQLDRDLVSLEQQPDSRELVSGIFRTIHTIKGTSGFLAFTRLEAVTHAGESLLARLRDGTQPVTADTISTLLAMVDAVRSLLSAIESSGGEGDLSIDNVVAVINRQMEAGDSPVVPPPPPATQPGSEAAGAAQEAPVPPKKTTTRRRASKPAPKSPAEEPSYDARRPVGELLVEQGGVQPADVASALLRQIEGDERHVGTILVDEGKATAGAVNDALAAQGKRSVADSAIRVDVDLLDSLMNLVGELVLVRNQLMRSSADSRDPALSRTTQRLNLITSELQEGIMKTRMQPIDQLWSKLPRVVRDLSQGFGKQIKLAMEGKETELDRSLLEAVKDPLTHLVRNAVDHGIESPDERVAAGKDP